MAITYTQTDNSITFDVGCSGRSAGVTTGGRGLVEGGTPGVTDVSVDPGNNTEAAVFALRTTGGVGADTWAAGDYVVSLNISGANGTSQWTETHICERTAGGAFNTVASLTGQTTDVSQAGVVSHTVNRATDFTPVGTDSDLFIVVVLSNADSHGNSTTSILPDQDVVTPIESSEPTFVALAGAMISASAASALLATTVALEGVGASVSDAGSALVLESSLEAASLSASQADGELDREMSLASESISESDATARLEATLILVGGLMSSSQALAASSIDIGLAGDLDSVTTLDGTLSIGGQLLLSGALASESQLGGALNLDQTLSGTSTSQSDLEGQALLDVLLTGAALSASMGAGTLSIDGEFLLSGVLASDSAMSGAASNEIGLSGDLESESGASGALYTSGSSGRLTVDLIRVLPSS